MSTLNVGDQVQLDHGPFASTWEVIEIVEAGAILAWLGQVWFTGYTKPMLAPNGTQLTTNPMHAFLGRALWDNVKKVEQ